ncbi:MAG: glycogen debranching protein GlgX [Hyphomicrobiales bacterium]|nr:glycogen debranching protein GlgX [Hyphomicrobiales bacterium]MDE2116128.1 glycogen debranching protein GlgX [Hyphomicrobiales bacterium]
MSSTAFHVGQGLPQPLGVQLDAAGVNVAVFSQHASAIDFCLFDPDGKQTHALRLTGRTHDVFHGHIAGVRAGQLYGLRAHGAYNPGAGHRFNPAKLLVDPYASRLDRPIVLHLSMYDFDRDDHGKPDGMDSAPFMAKAIVEAKTEPPVPARPRHSLQDTLIYEVHIASFTRKHPDLPVQHRGTVAGLMHPAIIAHFKQLGVTALEWMPCAAWNDERHLPPLGLQNVWGYNPVAFAAPEPRIAPGGWQEIRACVDAYHGAGIEIILDVVFNHTGESDAFGASLNLRGLDNSIYYRLDPHNLAAYVNDTGCGHTLALDHPANIDLVLHALRQWAVRGGVDGFRFDLATIMGRSAEGFAATAPLLNAILADDVLKDLKLIAEPWDIGPGGYQLGRFPPRFLEWNDQFRDDVRKFWRGDAGTLGGLATRLSGSSDLFAGKGQPSASLNFVAAHDGFTLADLTAYSHKHNQANGEDNRDGTHDNHSWNHGHEGHSRDPQILEARLRDQANLLSTLLLARGTPMLSMGCEFAHSQNGNNNAYAKEYPVHWSRPVPRLRSLIQRLIALRKAHPALHHNAFLSGMAAAPNETPDVAWHRADGEPLSDADWHAPEAGVLGMGLFTPPAGDMPQDQVLVLLNASFRDVEFTLPVPTFGYRWQIALDTSALPKHEGTGDEWPCRDLAGMNALTLPARAVLLLCALQQPASANA